MLVLFIRRFISISVFCPGVLMKNLNSNTVLNLLVLSYLIKKPPSVLGCFNTAMLVTFCKTRFVFDSQFVYFLDCCFVHSYVDPSPSYVQLSVYWIRLWCDRELGVVSLDTLRARLCCSQGLLKTLMIKSQRMFRRTDWNAIFIGGYTVTYSGPFIQGSFIYTHPSTDYL